MVEKNQPSGQERERSRKVRCPLPITADEKKDGENRRYNKAGLFDENQRNARYSRSRVAIPDKKKQAQKRQNRHRHVQLRQHALGEEQRRCQEKQWGQKGRRTLASFT